MASNYPGALDTFTDKTNDVDNVDASHVNNLQDSVEAIQGELGTDPAGASATVKARLDALDTTVSGKAATSHSHAASDVTSGTVATARLGSGTASASTYLRGDQTWASITTSAGLPSSFVTRTTTATASVGQFVLADATSAGFTVTLPSGTSVGDLVAVKKVDSTTNVVTVAPPSGTIDGDANATIVSEDAGGVFEWDGTNWRVVSIFSTSGTGVGLLAANNLSDLASAATARTNLGLGSLATLNSVPAAVIGGGKAGDLYVWKQSLGTTVTMTAGREFCIPFVLPAGRSVSAVSVHVSTLAASSTVRIGWRLDGDGWPSTLQADLGTVAADSTGNKDLSVPFSPTPLTLWWLSVVGQGGNPVLKAGLRYPLGDMLEGNVLATDAKTAGLRGSPLQDSVTGALPSTGPTRANPSNTGTALPPFAILTLA